MADQSTRTRLRVDIETLVGLILLVGLLASVTLILSGLVWNWRVTGTLRLDYSMGGGTNLFGFAVAELSLLAHGSVSPRMVISLGITVPLLTPYVRVLAPMLYFALVEHDIKYSCFTGFVLVILSYSLFLS